jgi:hypothetical protein
VGAAHVLRAGGELPRVRQLSAEVGPTSAGRVAVRVTADSHRIAPTSVDLPQARDNSVPAVVWRRPRGPRLCRADHVRRPCRADHVRRPCRVEGGPTWRTVPVRVRRRACRIWEDPDLAATGQARAGCVQGVLVPTSRIGRRHGPARLVRIWEPVRSRGRDRAEIGRIWRTVPPRGRDRLGLSRGDGPVSIDRISAIGPETGPVQAAALRWDGREAGALRPVTSVTFSGSTGRCGLMAVGPRRAPPDREQSSANAPGAAPEFLIAPGLRIVRGLARVPAV